MDKWKNFISASLVDTVIFKSFTYILPMTTWKGFFQLYFLGLLVSFLWNIRILIKENSVTKSTKFTALENYHIYSKRGPNLMTFLTCHWQSTTHKMSEFKLNCYSCDGYWQNYFVMRFLLYTSRFKCFYSGFLFLRGDLC